MITLQIDKYLIDLDTDIAITETCNVDSTDIVTRYSKTITIPFTKDTNKCFRTPDFNADLPEFIYSKIRCNILKDGVVLMTGYLILNTVDYNNEVYNCTFYDISTDFFNLLEKDTDNNEFTLYNMKWNTYYDDGTVNEDEQMIMQYFGDVTYNTTWFKNYWSERVKDSVDRYYIDYIPVDDGDDTPSSVVMDTIGLSDLSGFKTSSKNYGGYQNLIVAEGAKPDDREIRVNRCQPAIRLSHLFMNLINQNGFIGSIYVPNPIGEDATTNVQSFFNSPYWKDAYITLDRPSTDKVDYNAIVDGKKNIGTLSKDEYRYVELSENKNYEYNYNIPTRLINGVEYLVVPGHTTISMSMSCGSLSFTADSTVTTEIKGNIPAQLLPLMVDQFGNILSSFTPPEPGLIEAPDNIPYSINLNVYGKDGKFSGIGVEIGSTPDDPISPVILTATFYNNSIYTKYVKLRPGLKLSAPSPMAERLTNINLSVKNVTAAYNSIIFSTNILKECKLSPKQLLIDIIKTFNLKFVIDVNKITFYDPIDFYKHKGIVDLTKFIGRDRKNVQNINTENSRYIFKSNNSDETDYIINVKSSGNGEKEINSGISLSAGKSTVSIPYTYVRVDVASTDIDNNSYTYTLSPYPNFINSEFKMKLFGSDPDKSTTVEQKPSDFDILSNMSGMQPSKKYYYYYIGDEADDLYKYMYNYDNHIKKLSGSGSNKLVFIKTITPNIYNSPTEQGDDKYKLRCYYLSEGRNIYSILNNGEDAGYYSEYDLVNALNNYGNLFIPTLGVGFAKGDYSVLDEGVEVPFLYVVKNKYKIYMVNSTESYWQWQAGSGTYSDSPDNIIYNKSYILMYKYVIQWSDNIRKSKKLEAKINESITEGLAYLTSNGGIYPKYFNSIISNIKDNNGNTITVYVKYDDLRFDRLYNIDNGLYFLTKINNKQLNDTEFCECTFVKCLHPELLMNKFIVVENIIDYSEAEEW